MFEQVAANVIEYWGTVYQSEAEPGAMSLPWNGVLLALSDGVSASVLPLLPSRLEGCNLVTAVVRYRATATAAPRELLVYVDCVSGAIAGFFELVDAGGLLVLGSIALAPGSTVNVPFLRLNTTSGAVSEVEGPSLLLPEGAASLEVYTAATPAGSYRLYAIVSDIAGNSSAGFRTVTVP
ncbi:MAG: hypothetical protein L0206_11240 [Actinobacteria bacterium]|nr:hypothetical protein [Actinomycetota bacterium]